MNNSIYNSYGNIKLCLNILNIKSIKSFFFSKKKKKKKKRNKNKKDITYNDLYILKHLKSFIIIYYHDFNYEKSTYLDFPPIFKIN